jgi:hypothetical protein
MTGALKLMFGMFAGGAQPGGRLPGLGGRPAAGGGIPGGRPEPGAGDDEPGAPTRWILAVS